MTEAEYLAFERTSEIKHEYLDGQIYAMTGASQAHNQICFNVGGILYGQLSQKPCQGYPSDMRVKVQATGLYTYPDLSVVCGDSQLADGEFDTLLNPTLIIEVLSPSTESYDRGKKFQHYRQLESLQDYVLIAQDSPRIERFTRQTDDTWLLTDAVGMDAALDLPSIGCTLTLADVYQKVTFEADDPEAPKVS
jgi:Uma2 family endonuclease